MTMNRYLLLKLSPSQLAMEFYEMGDIPNTINMKKLIRFYTMIQNAYLSSNKIRD